MTFSKIVYTTSCAVAVLLLTATTSRADWPDSFQFTGALYVSDYGLTQVPAADFNDNDTYWEGTSLSWDVSFDAGTDITIGDGWATYTYTFGNPEDQDLKDLSHFVIELSDGLTLENGLRNLQYYDPNDSAAIDDWVTYYIDKENDDPDFSTNIDGLEFYGLKLDFALDSRSEWRYRFESQRAPMWGNVYLKDGDPLAAYNASYPSSSGLLNAVPEGMSIWDFYGGEILTGKVSTSIPGTSGGAFAALVPDTEPIHLMPEPCSGALALLLAVTGLAARRSRRSAG